MPLFCFELLFLISSLVYVMPQLNMLKFYLLVESYDELIFVPHQNDCPFVFLTYGDGCKKLVSCGGEINWVFRNVFEVSYIHKSRCLEVHVYSISLGKFCLASGLPVAFLTSGTQEIRLVCTALTTTSKASQLLLAMSRQVKESVRPKF